MPSPLALVLRDPCLDELPHQRRGEGFVGGKADGALGGVVRCERFPVRPREGGAHEEAAVMLDRLRRGGLDPLAHLLESGPRGGWDRSKVGGHRGWLFHRRANRPAGPVWERPAGPRSCRDGPWESARRWRLPR